MSTTCLLKFYLRLSIISYIISWKKVFAIILMIKQNPMFKLMGWLCGWQCWIHEIVAYIIIIFIISVFFLYSILLKYQSALIFQVLFWTCKLDITICFTQDFVADKYVMYATQNHMFLDTCSSSSTILGNIVRENQCILLMSSIFLMFLCSLIFFMFFKLVYPMQATKINI